MRRDRRFWILAMRSKKAEELIEALEPVAESNGFEVVDVQILGKSGSPILRIYIDLLDGDIDLDDITEAQRSWLEPIVDELDVISGNYMLEVSSPGIDRPLRTRKHFRDYAGEDIKLTSEPIDGRRRFNGVLKGMEGDDVIVEIDGELYSVPFGSVQSAHVVGKIDF